MQYDQCPYPKKAMRRQGHTRTVPRDGEGTGWGNAATSQGGARIVSKPPETRKRQERIPLQASEMAQPYKLLDFRLLSSRIMNQ